MHGWNNGSLEGNVKLAPAFVVEKHRRLMFALYHHFNVYNRTPSSRRPTFLESQTKLSSGFLSAVLQQNKMRLFLSKNRREGGLIVTIRWGRATKADISTSEHSDPVLIEG